MAGGAPRPQGPRPQPGWRAVLLLAGFLLVAPPVFVLGPLAGLLLVSRPASRREWVWVAGLIAWSGLWLQQSGGVNMHWVRAAAVLLSGAFVALTVWRPSQHFSRALVATGLAGAALGAWTAALEIEWATVRRAVEADLAAYHRALQAELAGANASREMLAQMSDLSDTVALLYPGLVALAAIGGLRLAWAWYHRIAERPLGPPPAPFAAFRFSDQLVWGGVAGLALCLMPLSEAWRTVGVNLLLVWAVLYATRGLAIFSAGSARVPRPVLAALTLVAMFMLPFVLGGLTLLGLADTWLDFRRRLAASATGG
ncbi:MAG: DUF2232 domain-containing protein [Gemmatimonadales bacterium]|nr:DUF2232 domain-containing protein [Gemmatimonadales bacterium]